MKLDHRGDRIKVIVVVAAIALCVIATLAYVIDYRRRERRKHHNETLLLHLRQITNAAMTIDDLIFCRDAYVAKQVYVRVVHEFVNNSNSPLRVSFTGTLSPSTYLLTDEEGVDVVIRSPHLVITEHPGFDGECQSVSPAIDNFELMCCDLHHSKFMNEQACDRVDADVAINLVEINAKCDVCVVYVRNEMMRSAMRKKLDDEHMLLECENVDFVTNCQDEQQLYRVVWQRLLESRHRHLIINRQGPYIWLRVVLRDKQRMRVMPGSIFGASDMRSVVRVSSVRECDMLLALLDNLYDTSSRSYVDCLSDCTKLMTRIRSVNSDDLKNLALRTYETFSAGDPLSNPLLDRCKSPLFALLCRNSHIETEVLRLVARRNHINAFDVLLDCVKRSPFQDLVHDIYAIVRVMSDDIQLSSDVRSRLLEVRDEAINQGKSEAVTHINALLNFYCEASSRPDYVISNRELLVDVVMSLRSKLSDKVKSMHELTKNDELIKSRMLVLTTDADISRCLGPLNPKLIMSSYEDEEYVCSVFGCRMLTCNCISNIDEDEDDPEEDWFRGVCDRCQIHIKSPSHATRIPLAEGSWRGCFCSTGEFDCVRQYVTECVIMNDLNAISYMNPLSRVYEALIDTSLLEYDHL